MTKGRIGRPRSEAAKEAILAATHDLLNESGAAGLSIEAIAKRAKVGKPTIYRWWPTLADIVLDVLLQRADRDIPLPTCGTPFQKLRHFLRLSMQSIADGNGVHLRFLMAQAQKDDDFSHRFRTGFTGKRRAVLRSIVADALQDNAAPAHGPDIIVDIIFGAMWYRLLVGHADMDEAFADELAEIAMKLLAADPRHCAPAQQDTQNT